MSSLVALPVLVPLTGAILGLVAWRRPLLQRVFGLAAALAMAGVGGLLLARVRAEGALSVAFGSWPGPFGIVFVADTLSAVLVLLAGVMGTLSLAYAAATVDREREARAYHPLSLVVLAGVAGAFLTGDLFNLYVWFEVLLIASFVLVVQGGTRRELSAGVRYVVLNLVSSVVFLTALGLLYGTQGTVNMAQLATVVESAPSPATQAAGLLLLLSFGIKAAVFPLYFWLPSAYTAPPAASSALFAGILTKVGVYAILRTFTLVFPALAWADGLLYAIAALTMVLGVVGAYAKSEIDEILAFHSVSQVGYMLMGIAIGTPLALAGTLFFVLHHSLVKGGLFLVAGLVDRLEGSTALHRLGGLADRGPALAAAFAVPALSLAGVPPLSGFWAKVVLLWAGLEANAWLLVAAALATGLVTLMSMTKIWSQAFWGPSPTPAPARISPAALAPVGLLVLGAILLGLGADPVIDVALEAARDLTDTDAYLRAAVGGQAG